jgi:hypothetical protein
MDQELFDQISRDIARHGHAWRTVASYGELELDWRELVSQESAAAARLAGNLSSNSQAHRLLSAARTLLESIYADQYEDPTFWTTPVGQRICRVVQYPKSRVPAKIVAAMTGLSRQRVWQLASEGQLDSTEEQGERVALTAESVFGYMQAQPAR